MDDEDVLGAPPLRVGVIDDHPLVRGGLERLIASTDDMKLGCSLASPSELPAEAGFDVMVLDLYLGGDTPDLDVIHDLSKRCPVLVVSASGRGGDILDSMEAGGAGYLTKQASDETILEGIRAVAARRTYLSSQLADVMAAEVRRRENTGSPCPLSERERQALGLIAEGFTHAQGARRMAVSEGTFDTYVKRIREKLGVGNKAQLTRKAVELGVVAEPDHI